MDPLFISVITHVAISIYICNVFGNLLVIVVITKNKKLRDSPNTFLLLSLAHSDVWFAVIAFVDIIVLSNQATCAYAEFFLNALASIYILVALAVERYFAILKPFVHMKRATKCLLVKVLLVIYFLAVVLSAPGYYIGHARKTFKYAGCRNETTSATRRVAPVWFETLSTVYSSVLFVFGFILPTAVIIFCYFRVICHVWFNADANKATSAGLLKSRRKLTKLFILVTVVFLITWAPTFGRLIVSQYSAHEQETLKFELFSMLLGLLGSTANPVIYSFRCPRFRQEVVKLLTCRCCKRKIQPNGVRTVCANSYSLTKMDSTRRKTVEPVSLISMRIRK